MSTSDSCKEGASKSNDDDGVCEVNDMLQNMNTDDKDNVVSVCANCGKEGSSDNMNICNKCKQVKYCNAACKKKHRSKHKKQCERRVAELHDQELFKLPPSLRGDCPICFVRMPTIETGYKYYPCCGKVICSGCVHAPLYDNQGNEVDNKKCAFCRTPSPASNEAMMERIQKRLEAEDSIAIHNVGVWHRDGRYGYPQDDRKALELWQRAEDLGFAKAYTDIGWAYDEGLGVDADREKATYYTELAAMGGDAAARDNLGIIEANIGNIDRAVTHFMIASRDGFPASLKVIKQLYSMGHATKEVYTTALRSYQTYLSEIKSPQRDEAAAFSIELYRYY